MPDVFTQALEVIAQVMRDGVATHPDNEWVRWPADYHLARAEQHLRRLRDGDQQQDHLSPRGDSIAHGARAAEVGIVPLANRPV